MSSKKIRDRKPAGKSPKFARTAAEERRDVCTVLVDIKRQFEEAEATEPWSRATRATVIVVINALLEDFNHGRHVGAHRRACRDMERVLEEQGKRRREVKP